MGGRLWLESPLADLGAEPVTIAGTNTAGATAVTVSGPGIAVSGVTSTATTVSATFTIAASALTSARNVTVTTPAGVSNAVTFTVTPVPVPTLTSIAPNSGAQGSAVSVTLTGANFVTGDNVVITPSATGVSVSGVSVVSPTTMTAVITSTGAAALGAVNVAAVSTTGSSATQPFTITSAPPPTAPVLTALNPIQGLRRAGPPNPIVVTLTGSNFTPTGTTINVASANGLFITGVTYLNSTTLRATFNTTNTAAIGPRSITVTTPNGTSNALTYTVLGPVLNSISPASGARGGAAIPVTLLGTGLTGNVAINVSGGGITVSNVVVAPGGGKVTANFTVAANAAATARTVTVSTPNGGTSNSVTFTVN